MSWSFRGPSAVREPGIQGCCSSGCLDSGLAAARRPRNDAPEIYGRTAGVSIFIPRARHLR
jgi:hypothetical protein